MRDIDIYSYYRIIRLSSREISNIHRGVRAKEDSKNVRSESSHSDLELMAQGDHSERRVIQSGQRERARVQICSCDDRTIRHMHILDIDLYIF